MLTDPNMNELPGQACSGARTRRQTLGMIGGGFGSLALADLLHTQQARAAGAAPGHFAPRAKSVIFLFMSGGPSHIDMLDPKPSIKEYEGQRPAAVDLRTERVTRGLLPSPFEFRPGGECGTEVSDLLPYTRQCVDDMCVVRSVIGGNPNHAPAANWLFSGRIDQIHPSLGAWVSYGLGAENSNLPGFVSLKKGGSPSRYVRNGYLPGQHLGTPIDINSDEPDKMIRYLRNSGLNDERQLRQLEFMRRLNRSHLEDRGVDDQLDARIRAMETAYNMQFTAGEACDLHSEPQHVREAYGEGYFSNGCLLARRLVERGVRFIHIEHSRWDHHENLNSEIARLSQEVDQPIAALLVDLKQRGLLDETLVVWGGEFGRTPVSENGNGRDHNHYGFTMWLAGGGIKGGITHGATDEFGFKAVEDRVTVHDLHATILHLLGLDHEQLTYRYSGRDFRLTDVHGRVVDEILT